MIQRKYCSTIPVFIKQVFCNAVNIFTTQVKQLIERRHQIQSYIETRIDEQRKTFDPQNIRNLLDLYLEQEGHTDAKMSGTPFSFTNPIYSCKFIKITYSIQRGNDVLFIGIKPNTVFFTGIRLSAFDKTILSLLRILLSKCSFIYSKQCYHITSMV